MKFLIISMFVAWSQMVEAKSRFIVPSDFVKVELPGVSAAWKHRSQQRNYIVITEDKSSRPMSFSGASHAEIVKGITGWRRATLNAFGMQQWVLENLKAQKIGADHYKLELTGSYENTRKEKVQFYEIQYYMGSQFYQISYVETAPQFSKKISEIQRTLSSFSPVENE